MPEEPESLSAFASGARAFPQSDGSGELGDDSSLERVREGLEILQEAPEREHLGKQKGSMKMQALQRMLHHRMMTRGGLGM